jgi:hypothetical protein
MDKAQVKRGIVPHYSERGIGMDIIGMDIIEYTSVRRGDISEQCRVPAADSQLCASVTQCQKA